MKVVVEVQEITEETLKIQRNATTTEIAQEIKIISQDIKIITRKTTIISLEMKGNIRESLETTQEMVEAIQKGMKVPGGLLKMIEDLETAELPRKIDLTRMKELRKMMQA
jgi:plasmid maintenance system antidote protein VapI